MGAMIEKEAEFCSATISVEGGRGEKYSSASGFPPKRRKGPPLKTLSKTFNYQDLKGDSITVGLWAL